MTEKEIYQRQDREFKNIVFNDYFSFLSSSQDKDVFNLYSKEYKIQRYFDGKIEEYIKEILLRDTISLLLINYKWKSININLYGETEKFRDFKVDYRLEKISANNSVATEVGAMKINDFFDKFLDVETYNNLCCFVENEINDYKECISVKSVPVLSNYSYGLFRFKLEDSLNSYLEELKNQNLAQEKIKSLDSEMIISYGYCVLNKNDKKYLGLENNSRKLLFVNNLYEKFINNNLIEVLLSRTDFSKCLLSSEFLYQQHFEDYNFDYTSIVSGYLKSIEQILYDLVMLNLDEKTKGDNFYKIKRIGSRNKVELTTENIEIFDTTLGSLIKFFIDYSHLINLEDEDKGIVLGCLGCYKDECRNGSFHKNIIDKKSKIEFIRNNTFYLYIIILTSFDLKRGKKSIYNKHDMRLEIFFSVLINNLNHIYEFTFNNNLIFKGKLLFKDSLLPVFDDYGFIISIKLVFVGENGEKCVINHLNIPKQIKANDGINEYTIF